MSDPDNTPKSSAHPPPGRWIELAEIVWHRVVNGLAAVGTVLIGVLMLIICADIVARNVFGSSLPLISELGALTLVMIVYLQLAATVRADRLAKTEIFFYAFRSKWPRAGALLAAVFDVVGALMIGLIALSTIRILGKDYVSGEFIGVPGIATIPTWPFRVLILLGVTITCIEFIIRVITSLKQVASAERPQ